MTLLGRKMARLNRVVFNYFVGPVLTRLPGFGVVHHVGRKSGREYRTPVKFFRHAGDYVITLPYGPGADWVRNVLAAEGCDLDIRGRRTRLVKPTVFLDDGSVHIPKVLRMVLSFMKITEFIALTPDTPD
jgi:deazaflavin-dependent oxidoreductase (nitroreductase family)